MTAKLHPAIKLYRDTKRERARRVNLSPLMREAKRELERQTGAWAAQRARGREAARKAK